MVFSYCGVFRLSAFVSSCAAAGAAKRRRQHSSMLSEPSNEELLVSLFLRRPKKVGRQPIFDMAD